MTADLGFLRSSFDRFNDEIFGGSLPPVEIRLSRARSFLGKVEYKVRRGLLGIGAGNYAFVMRISTSFDLSEAELEDVLIHEMIHYYIAFHNLKDSSVHGETFRQIMEIINQKYGRHITVRHHGEPEQNLVRDGSTQYRKHYLCVSTFLDGNRGVTVCASTKIFELYRLLPKYYQISKMEWYGSIDPFFNRFPRANTPKIYKITEEELSEHLRESVPLKCGGHTIEPAD